MTRKTAMTIEAVSKAATPGDLYFRMCGTRTKSELTAASASKTRCVSCVPMEGIKIKLTTSAPMIAPKVFAAETLPTTRVEFSSDDAAAARASGKLALHKIVGG